jgi:hypothetical protein
VTFKPHLTAEDERQLRERGISLEEAHRQLALLASPPPPTRLLRPCTVGDGIRRIPEADQDRLIRTFQEAVHHGRASRFVPASGAASRMFQQLLPWAVEDPEEEAGDPAAVRRFREQLHRLPFAAPLREALAGRGLDLQTASDEDLLRTLLRPEHLGFANAPKALIPFHRYGESWRTAFAEHLVEGAATLADADGLCRLHFTVIPAAEGDFQRHAERAQAELFGPGSEPRIRFAIDYSAQSPATDTLALGEDGEPFRRSDGRLLLRPGGHGSLLGNLQGCQGDLVFIKNIDNVVPDARKGPTLRWKRILGGLIVELEARFQDLEARLERDAGLADAGLADAGLADEVLAVLKTELGWTPRTWPAEEAARQALLLDRLGRPLRVCGVVINTGEPGGGPFWVRGGDGEAAPQSGEVAAQIVEMAQIDTGDPEQRAAVAGATHFNPVDLVCTLKDRHGRPFDLTRFRDPANAFVARKSHGGRPLLALEHPGLWNGAMARWNTVFVEVPVETFAPVKTVFDLLRPEHQG